MKWAISVAILSAFTFAARANDTLLHIPVGNQDLVSYQAKPMANPKGGEKFQGSNFIHPLKSPSGFVVTAIQPADHLHHFGLWWPWKYVEVEGRKILCWELQQGDGLIEAKASELTVEGCTTHSLYIDRKAPGQPQTVIHETTRITTSSIVDRPSRGYHLDIEITHEVALDKPITVSTYRYSGFAIRATSAWTNGNSSVLTSEGMDRDTSNFTRAKWVRVQGESTPGQSAGVLLMSDTGNYDHPELLRTWNRSTHDGAVFINFNSVQAKPWVMEPGQPYTRKFRAFVYDGTLTADQAEALWKQYAQPVGSAISES